MGGKGAPLEESDSRDKAVRARMLETKSTDKGAVEAGKVHTRKDERSPVRGSARPSDDHHRSRLHRGGHSDQPESRLLSAGRGGERGWRKEDSARTGHQSAADNQDTKNANKGKGRQQEGSPTSTNGRIQS